MDLSIVPAVRLSSDAGLGSYIKHYRVDTFKGFTLKKN